MASKKQPQFNNSDEIIDDDLDEGNNNLDNESDEEENGLGEEYEMDEETMKIIHAHALKNSQKESNISVDFQKKEKRQRVKKDKKRGMSLMDFNQKVISDQKEAAERKRKEEEKKREEFPKD